MADIFLSYSEKDRETAQELAQGLQALGWTVWWDRVIPAGETWSKVIERALDDMRCMVVLWSAKSVDSGWVYEEAEEGRSRKKLVPVLIERVKPPAGFRSLQAADLVDWDGSTEAPAFRRLVADIERRLGRAPVPLPARPDDPKPRPPWLRYGVWSVIGTSAVAALAWYALRSPNPVSAVTEAPQTPASAVAPEPTTNGARPIALDPLPANGQGRPKDSRGSEDVTAPPPGSSAGTLPASGPPTLASSSTPRQPEGLQGPARAEARTRPPVTDPTPSRRSRCTDLLEREQAGSLSAADLQTLTKECR